MDMLVPVVLSAHSTPCFVLWKEAEKTKKIEKLPQLETLRVGEHYLLYFD